MKHLLPALRNYNCTWALENAMPRRVLRQQPGQRLSPGASVAGNWLQTSTLQVICSFLFRSRASEGSHELLEAVVPYLGHNSAYVRGARLLEASARPRHGRLGLLRVHGRPAGRRRAQVGPWSLEGCASGGCWSCTASWRRTGSVRRCGAGYGPSSWPTTPPGAWCHMQLFMLWRSALAALTERSAVLPAEKEILQPLHLFSNGDFRPLEP